MDTIALDSRSRRAPKRPLTRSITLGLVAALAAISLSACGSSFNSGGAPAQTDVGYTEQNTLAGGDASSRDMAPAPSSDYPSEPGSGVSSDQRIVTGNATVRTDDPAGALEKFTALAKDLGGEVTYSTVSLEGSQPMAYGTARVPAVKYEELVAALPTLGEVLSTQSSSEDVGQQVADLDARIKALEVSIARLTELMQQAQTTADLLEAENQMTSRQAELDSLKSQRQWLGDAVARSTLMVTFSPHVDIYNPNPSIWERAWTALRNSAEYLLVFVVAALPWILLALVILWPIIALIRSRERKRMKRFAKAADEARAAQMAAPVPVPAAVPASNAPDADPALAQPQASDPPQEDPKP